jgi:hypothetical protein
MGPMHMIGAVERKLSLLVGDLRNRINGNRRYHNLSNPTPNGSNHTSSDSIFGRIRARPKLAFTIAFGCLYVAFIFYFRAHGYNDPTSWFYSQEHGNDKHYSLIRAEQSEAFLLDANTTTTPPPKVGDNPDICLAVATVKRPGEQYIRHTVASLLEGLTEQERASLHFVFFIAHVNQTVHAIHGEPWTTSLPDTFLQYQDGVNDEEMKEIEVWEEKHDYIKKGLFDYSYLLRACANTRAPYIAMLEGDVLAARGWYPLARRAVHAVDDITAASTAITKPGETDPPRPSWLYLRLFYTEAYFGWNSEFWFTYLLISAGLALILGVSLIALRATLLRSSPNTVELLSNQTILVLVFVFLPLCIILWFAAGRATVLPLPTGPQRMENYGCCSQGFIFSREQVPLVLDKIENPSRPYMDMLMEAVAEEEHLQRWAVVPSLLQHVGGKSSKGDEVADRNAKRIWNFGFEGYGEDGLMGKFV